MQVYMSANKHSACVVMYMYGKVDACNAFVPVVFVFKLILVKCMGYVFELFYTFIVCLLK